MARLTNDSLDALPEIVGRPRYPREAVATGIVHFGVGGFHRSHLAMYIDSLMNEGLAMDWGICGIGLLPSDARMRDALQGQDCLYSLMLKNSDGSVDIRVIGSIVEYLFAPDAPEAVLGKLTDPAIRIVSLTITEGGYNFNPLSGRFDETTPAIVADAAGGTPATVFGYVVEALRRRRDAGIEPFTVMSCDNIQSNGAVARNSFVSFARMLDPTLAEWIDSTVHFPNSMVDRITPVTTADDVDRVGNTAGIDDAWPVVCEPFAQWVLEDSFTAGRPPVEAAGAQLVADVIPYELMKLRLLNVSHQAMAYFGYLSGYRYAHEVAGDPEFVRFVRGYMDDEATPTLLPVPGIDLEAYKAELIARFANPEVRDTLVRLCAETSDRIPKWLVPIVEAQIARGGSVARSAGIIASWARYAEGIDEQGAPIDVIDRLSEQLTATATAQGIDGTAFIDNAELFGDIGGNTEFVSAYRAALRSLHEQGARSTVRHLG